MKPKPTFISLLLVSGNMSKDRQECHPTSGEVAVLGCPGGSSCLRASREKRHSSQARDRREEYHADSRVLIRIASCATEKHVEKKNGPCSLSPGKTILSGVATLWAGQEVQNEEGYRENVDIQWTRKEPTRWQKARLQE